MDQPLKYTTREQWLEAAVEKLRPIFKGKNFDIPPVKVSTGWPSRGGLSTKKRTLGQCWERTASEDAKTAQVFVSPLLLEDGTDWGVLSVLTHEICHAVAGPQQGHGKKFREIGNAVGLEGKPAQMVAGPDLLVRFKQWIDDDLGPYPHQKLNPAASGVKKQTTRMMKCTCEDCGYVARTTRKWVEEKGTLICPCNGKRMKSELPVEDAGE